MRQQGKLIITSRAAYNGLPFRFRLGLLWGLWFGLGLDLRFVLRSVLVLCSMYAVRACFVRVVSFLGIDNSMHSLSSTLRARGWPDIRCGMVLPNMQHQRGLTFESPIAMWTLHSCFVALKVSR